MKKGILFVSAVVVTIFIVFDTVYAKNTITVHYYTADASEREKTYIDASAFLGYAFNVKGYDGVGNGSVESQLSNSVMFIVHNHGAPGKQYLSGSTGIVGKGGDGTNWKSINSMTGNSSKSLYMAIFYGCQTGTSSSTYGSLIEQTTSKFAKSAVAWTIDTYVSDVNLWNQYLVQYMKLNSTKTVATALTYADTNLAVASGAVNATGMKNSRVTSGSFSWKISEMSV